MLCLLFQLSISELKAEYKLGKQQVTQMLQSAKALEIEGRNQDAVDILEKILMIDSAAEGVADSYRRLLNKLAQQQAQSITDQNITTDWQSNGKLSVSVGGGDNLNRAPADKNIKISLSAGDAELTLNKDQQPQGGYGVETSVSVWGVKKITPKNTVNLAMQMQHRATDQKNFTDYLRINSGASIQHELANEDELAVAVFADVMHYDNEARFYSLDALTRYTWKNNQQCNSHMGLDMQWRHQKDNKLYDSLYSGMAVGASCYALGGGYSAGISAGNEWGLDKNRPGGGQWRLDAYLNHNKTLDLLRSKDAINGYVNMMLMSDQQSYSALLANGEKRQMGLVLLGAQYRLPIGRVSDQWWGVLKTEWQKQVSNIPLFEFQSFEAWLGVEVQW